MLMKNLLGSVKTYGSRVGLMLTTLGMLSGCSLDSNVTLQTEYDIVVRNGTLIDGTGKPAYKADVAIQNGKIVKIGSIKGNAIKTIDATGKHISPGWIDMMDQSGGVLLENGDAANKLLMGVTSAIGGEAGTPVPANEIPSYFQTLEKQGMSLNFGTYYSAGQARVAVVGPTDVKATPEDIVKMQALVRTAMESGAVGVSSAAFYPPHSFLSVNELVEMSKVVSSYGGLYAAHMRDESRQLSSGIEEMITVGEKADVRVEIFHLKNAFAPNWGKGAKNAIEQITQARERGVDIAADQYPYIAGGTGIEATVPNWVFAEGEAKARSILSDPVQRDKLKVDIAHPNSDRMVLAAGGWKNIVLSNPKNEKYNQYIGQNFVEIGSALNKDPADAAWDILLEAKSRPYALYFMMAESDVQSIMKQPWVSIGSDAGGVVELGKVDSLGLPHPRSYGTFPRIIGKYVKKEKLFSLEEAIRKMTSLPAERMKLSARGEVKENYWADLVIFDFDTIEDKATWDKPFDTPTGIDTVIVNGVTVVEQGKHNGKRPGKVLYGPGLKR